MTSSHRNQAGTRAARAFSLIELIVVMFVIATIAGIATPRYFRSLSNYRVDAAARRIAADLAHARNIARTEARFVTVKFDNGNNKHFYYFDGEPDQYAPGEDYTVRLLEPPYRSTLGAVSFDGHKEMKFDRYGTARRGDKKPLPEPGTIIVRSGDFDRTIVVDPSTGKAVVQ